jgi:hypothetical protein
MAREFVDEATACRVRARFFGPGNIATIPATVRYRNKDVSNDRIVTDWTEVSADEVITIEVTADENRVYRDSSRKFQQFEKRVVVVQANFDMPTQASREIPYLIRNLRGFES